MPDACSRASKPQRLMRKQRNDSEQIVMSEAASHRLA